MLNIVNLDFYHTQFTICCFDRKMLSRCQLAFTRGMRTSAVKRTTNSKLPADQVAQELEKIPTPEKFKVGPLEEVPKFPCTCS